MSQNYQLLKLNPLDLTLVQPLMEFESSLGRNMTPLTDWVIAINGGGNNFSENYINNHTGIKADGEIVLELMNREKKKRKLQDELISGSKLDSHILVIDNAGIIVAISSVEGYKAPPLQNEEEKISIDIYNTIRNGYTNNNDLKRHLATATYKNLCEAEKFGFNEANIYTNFDEETAVTVPTNIYINDYGQCQTPSTGKSI